MRKSMNRCKTCLKEVIEKDIKYYKYKELILSALTILIFLSNIFGSPQFD